MVGLVVAVGVVWAMTRAQPGNASIEPISQLSTSDFHSLAFSATEPDTLFFGHHGGLLISRDSGYSWQPAALQNADAMALAAPPADPQTLYAAGHGIFYISSDGGATWEAVATELQGADIHGFAADPANAQHVYAHVVGVGLFASQDGGLTWAQPSTNIPGSTFNLAVEEGGATIYAAAGQAGLWQSMDGGTTWAALPDTPGEGAVAVTYDPGAGRLYVATIGTGPGLYVSSNGGASWTALELPGTIMALAISPHDQNRIVAVDGEGRVYGSWDGGTTWTDDK
jgi:photosystem II stability/assembly factor-like uncharacterized protein